MQVQNIYSMSLVKNECIIVDGSKAMNAVQILRDRPSYLLLSLSLAISICPDAITGVRETFKVLPLSHFSFISKQAIALFRTWGQMIKLH